MTIDELLTNIRKRAEEKHASAHAKGKDFERLMCCWLVADPLQSQAYAKAQSYSDWAKEQGQSQRDEGIDIVATRRDGGFVAVQCKCYEETSNKLAGLESFLSASSVNLYSHSLLIDTTTQKLSSRLQTIMDGRMPPVTRVNLEDLRRSPFDWSQIDPAQDKISLSVSSEKQQLHPYQEEALKGIRDGFQKGDRGKLIMACGTGKTRVALKAAESIAGTGKRVLFLAPSLSLVSQTMREWGERSDARLRSFAVCSDPSVMADQKKVDAEVNEGTFGDIAFPVTTDAKKLADSAGNHDKERMTVIFGTYQSLDKIATAQKHGLPEFDLIICDEAHKTTGEAVAFDNRTSGSRFTDIHDKNYVKGAKRLYMTATPRIFGVQSHNKTKNILYDMNQEEFYGKVFYGYSFGDAVREKHLTDYEVIVLQLDEEKLSLGWQKLLEEDDKTLKVDDAAKIVGCCNALRYPKNCMSVDASGKLISFEDMTGGKSLQRSIAFWHKVSSSVKFAKNFSAVMEKHESMDESTDEEPFACEVRHVDGKQDTKFRADQLRWLGENTDKKECRILSNARCLTEGIDVPNLDAVLFLNARKSQVDVVQSVGRVMRKMKGKEKGYVILPVVIPSGVSPAQAMEDNETYKVVWQVVNALKSHDNRLEPYIGNAQYNDNIFSKLRLFFDVSELQSKKSGKKVPHIVGKGEGKENTDKEMQQQVFEYFRETSEAVRHVIVERCGDSGYWNKWGVDMGKIAQKQIATIKQSLEQDNGKRKVFDDFLTEIRENLNDSITEEDAIDMLSQHIITEPVFRALFDRGNEFVELNSVSKAMKGVIAKLYEDNAQDESQSILRDLYDQVRRRTIDLDPRKEISEEKKKIVVEAKQKLIKQLYDEFFKNAFPALKDKLGIVYTPIEVVDFIIHSVNDLLKKEFDKTLGSKDVHIIDPFTGTGTFITRILQSNLIDEHQLSHKYKEEIHANDILLLAYYIASVNIETTYQGLVGGNYKPFEGICLTDTFALTDASKRTKDMVAPIMSDNNKRREKQKSSPIRVIIGNPPWRIGQGSEGDDAKNVQYEYLDERIRNTYVEESTAKLNKSAYDSYIRAIRWASDRLGEDGGIVGFVLNNSWVDSKSNDGMRKCLEEECSSIYIFNLRGKLDASSPTEGKNIFNVKVGISIVFLVKKPEQTKQGQVYYYDIGEEQDISDAQEKLAFLKDTKSIEHFLENNKLVKTQANDAGDWINKRESDFDKHIESGNKDKNVKEKIFEDYTLGVVTNRDPWCYNPSRTNLETNIQTLVKDYNAELERYKKSETKESTESFIAKGKNTIPFTHSLKESFQAGKLLSMSDGHFIISSYRPFFKQWVFFSRRLNERVYQNPRVFPHASSDNRTINFAQGKHRQDSFSVYMVDTISDLQFLFNANCFPLKLYEKQKTGDVLFEENKKSKSSITDYGLQHFQQYYDDKTITQEEIFYYTYAVLHSKEYREKYANNLNKEMPRIPTLGTLEDFKTFAKAGHTLGDLHVGYEKVKMFDAKFVNGSLNYQGEGKQAYFRVEKMKFDKNKEKEKDKTTIVYNDNITIADIPEKAYQYMVETKSAVEWIMDRQIDAQHEKSRRKKVSTSSEHIDKDANDYANETMNNPAYPLELLLRVITVSLKTLDIVNNLPKMKM